MEATGADPLSGAGGDCYCFSVCYAEYGDLFIVSLFGGVLIAGEVARPSKARVGALGPISRDPLLEFFIGILIAFFQRTGAIQNFTAFIERRAMSRVRVQLTAWLMGMFVYFSDYFSPLFVGSTMRACQIAIRYLAKLAHLRFNLCTCQHFDTHHRLGVFVAGLIIGMGPIENAADAMAAFTAAIPYNVCLIVLQWLG